MIINPYAFVDPNAFDPYFSSVVLLVDASNFTNGSTPSTIDVLGKTPTWRNNAQIKTDEFKFGSSSIYLDGTNDRVSFADSADWSFGTGDFTIECWVRPDGSFSGGQRILICNSASFGGFYSFRILRNTGDLHESSISNGASTFTGTSASITSSVWSHIAMSCVGGQYYACLNGVTSLFRNGSVTLMDSTGALTLGAYNDADGTLHWQGWIDQVRITKGVGRYGSGTYTVPSAKFPHA